MRFIFIEKNHFFVILGFFILLGYIGGIEFTVGFLKDQIGCRLVRFSDFGFWFDTLVFLNILHLVAYEGRVWFGKVTEWTQVTDI